MLSTSVLEFEDVIALVAAEHLPNGYAIHGGRHIDRNETRDVCDFGGAASRPERIAYGGHIGHVRNKDSQGRVTAAADHSHVAQLVVAHASFDDISVADDPNVEGNVVDPEPVSPERGRPQTLVAHGRISVLPPESENDALSRWL